MKRFVGQGIEFPSFHISFKMAVPSLSIEGRVPRAERGKFFGRKFLNLLFDQFNFTHISPWCQLYQPWKRVSARLKEAAVRCEWRHCFSLGSVWR